MKSSSGRSAVTCGWTTRPWARQRTSRAAWSSSRSQGPSGWPPTHSPRRGLHYRHAARPRAGEGPGDPRRGVRDDRGRTARSRMHAAAARGLTRLIGRDADLNSFGRPSGGRPRGSGQVVALVGEPGVGKSRLVWELTHSHRTHGWLIVEAGPAPTGRRRRTCRSSTSSRATSRSRIETSRGRCRRR